MPSCKHMQVFLWYITKIEMALSCGISVFTTPRNYQIAFQSLMNMRLINILTIKIGEVPISRLFHKYSVVLDVNFW